MTTSSLIDRLRRRIQDDRPSNKAMSVAVTDDVSTRAILELQDGFLSVTVTGGTAPSPTFNLMETRYDTIEKLYRQLTRLDGYTVTLDEDASNTHLSVDLFPIPPTDIGTGNSSAELKHYLFSASELDEILSEAVQRHNPSFNVSSLPNTEEVFVFQLAHAEVCRRQAYDSSKRKGLSETVDDLLSIARSLEDTYGSDVKRLARALQSPKETTALTDEGDIMIGTAYRTSPRTGFKSPIGQNTSPKPVILMEPDDILDVEDDNIKGRWQRTRGNDFYSQELWIDTIPDVIRSQTGLTFGGQPFAGTPVLINSDSNRGVLRKTTSKLVFRSWGANTNFDTATFHTFIEEFGQEITQYNVGDLEPDTEYFFRLYVQDLNYETTASNVVRYLTKSLRVRFEETNPVSPKSGLSGVVVTLKFDTTKGQFTAEHTIRFGGKIVPATIISPFEVTVVVPAFTVIRLPKDIVVTSPTGLFDIINDAYTVTGP